jgi:hypothetical protein
MTFVSDEFGRMKKTVVAYFMVASQHVLGETENPL